jgi:pimeloyl-ACP methyl ester carboxylesterase
MPTTTSTDGTKIGYDITGKGPAIILVAGATQYRAVDEATPKMAAELASRFTVINHDRRGRGESGNAQPYAVAREIEDIEALVKVAGGRAFLFGMSSGAVLAVEAAAALSSIDAVVAYEPPIDPAEPSKSSWQQYDAMAALAAKGEGPAMMKKFMSSFMSPDQLEGFIASPAWPPYAAVGHTIAHDYRILAEATDRNEHPARWKSIKARVLVMNGDQTWPFIVQGSDWMAAGVPGAKRKVLAGQSHQYDPTVMAKELAAFFGA